MGSGRLRERHSWTEGAVITALVVTGLLLFLAGQGHGGHAIRGATAAATTPPSLTGPQPGGAGGASSVAPASHPGSPTRMVVSKAGSAPVGAVSPAGPGGPATAVPTPPVTPSSAPSPGAPMLTGRVIDPAGNPVLGAYLIGLHSLAYLTTDNHGDFSMACPTEPLVVSSWLLPVTTTDASGNHVTPGPKSTPVASPLGYTFTGGATADTATVPACNGVPLTVTLPPSPTIRFTRETDRWGDVMDPDGTPTLDLPDLGSHAVPIADGADPHEQWTAEMTGFPAGPVVVNPGGLICQAPGQTTYTADPITLNVAVGQTVDLSCQ